MLDDGTNYRVEDLAVHADLDTVSDLIRSFAGHDGAIYNNLVNSELSFFSSFNGFASLRLRSIRNVAGVALIHMNHAERAHSGRIGVLDRQKMLFGLAEQKEWRNENCFRVARLRSFFVEYGFDLVVGDGDNHLTLIILKLNRLLFLVEDYVALDRVRTMFLTFYLRWKVLDLVEFNFRCTHSRDRN